MNILDTIVLHKRKEVAENKQVVSVQALEKRDLFQRQPVSIKAALMHPGSSGIIAEFKRKSPSKGIINDQVACDKTTLAYAQAGASALSVLTDHNFFGGSVDDFLAARRVNNCPMLRKDFVIDEYQIIEAKSIGADVILLIAAILDPGTIAKFVKLAHGLGMEVLLEVHDEKELLDNLASGADLMGVNNRNLKTFDVSIETSRRLSALIPDGIIKVSESGIEQVETIRELRTSGFRGFLLGQRFMEQSDPGLACLTFIQNLKKA